VTAQIVGIVQIFRSLSSTGLPQIDKLMLQLFKTGMPVAGSCSVAIAAGCHANVGNERAALKWVQRGATELDKDGSWLCGFSVGTVVEPRDGVVYR
jgi:hypothetical protein